MSKIVRVMLYIFLIMILLLEIFGAYMVYGFYSGKKSITPEIDQTKNMNFDGNKPVSKKEVTIMLIGDDGREDDEDEGRADTLMIAHYNTETQEPKLISIMRDCYVSIPDHGMEKINAAYAYGGAELTKKVLNDSFDLPINYYVSLDFTKFIRLINEVFPKGVEIDAEKDINLDGVDIKKGKQVMDGNTLLQYARFRMDEEGDFGRIKRQQQVMDAVVQQAKHSISPLDFPKIVGKVTGYIDTNVPPSLLIELAKDFLVGKVKPVKTLSVPVQGSWNFNDYTEAGSVLEIDPQENAKAIRSFLEEGD